MLNGLKKNKNKSCSLPFPAKKEATSLRLTASSSNYIGPSHPWSYSETHDMLVNRKSLQEQQLEDVQGASTNVAQCRRPLG